ncbi:class I SAM-dependent methyltransferase [Ponticoccus litoralis]|uniref:Class I SAM-dependent methyltransferase n=1 Tax=Ponticoccus litoralis TaxID=422297 RepID=A0AAW9SRY4_9RHOB
MSDPERSPHILRTYYDRCLVTHGDTAEGAGWPNEADRQTRFGIMRDLAPNGAMSDVCDLACGTGAFLEHLVASNAAPKRYLGLDISQAAITAAQAKHGTTLFALHDILHAPTPTAAPFDFVVANGLFTLKATLSQDDMWQFMESCVNRMWNMCRVGIAFNVMSSVVDWQREDLFHVPSDALLRMLYFMAGRRVILRSDYDLYEYTAYVYRDSVSARRI